MPYNTNPGYLYKSFSGVYNAENETMLCGVPGQSGEGSYGTYVPANIQIKAIP